MIRRTIDLGTGTTQAQLTITGDRDQIEKFMGRVSGWLNEIRLESAGERTIEKTAGCKGCGDR